MMVTPLGPGLSCPGSSLPIWALLLLAAAALAFSSAAVSAAGLRWPPPPMPFPPRPRPQQLQQQLLGRAAVAAAAQIDGVKAGAPGNALDDARRLAASMFNREILPIDVTPEERMIDQINALLQRNQGRLKPQQQMLRLGQDRQGEEEVMEEEGNEEEEVGGGAVGLEDVLVEAGLLPPPPPSPAPREGRGPGFTYRFTLPRGREAAEQGRYFAVNPSDPKYYTAAAIGRGGGGQSTGDGGSSWESMDEESEGGRPPTERLIRPMGRFPVVKPIEVVSTSGKEIPPIHGLEEEEDTNDIAGAVTAFKGSGDKGKVDKGELHMPHDSPVSHGDKHRSDLSSIPAEQVKREKPDKVPLDFGSDAYLTAIISGCTAAVVVGALAFAIFWYRLQRNAKAAADVEYPAYGVTGPNQEASAAAAAAVSSVSPTPHSGGSTSPLSAGDRRLAQSAQMYHYQHQKQQIIAMESRTSNERRGSVSEVDSEEENEEGDYTVYECPGLAPTGEMEVKNPLFHDDPTPATPSSGKNGRDQRGDGGASKP